MTKMQYKCFCIYSHHDLCRLNQLLIPFYRKNYAHLFVPECIKSKCPVVQKKKKKRTCEKTILMGGVECSSTVVYKKKYI